MLWRRDLLITVDQSKNDLADSELHALRVPLELDEGSREVLTLDEEVRQIRNDLCRYGSLEYASLENGFLKDKSTEVSVNRTNALKPDPSLPNMARAPSDTLRRRAAIRAGSSHGGSGGVFNIGSA
jgi:hypothetical protein